MSQGIAANSSFAGAAEGNFLDDLTNPAIGQWPKTQAIKGISKIVVWAGAIIDSVRITYLLDNHAPVEVKHGGDGGKEALKFDLGANEKLIGVYGLRLKDKCVYGSHSIAQLSFIIANFSQDIPTVTVRTVSGNIGAPAVRVKFELSWPLIAASSYTATPEGLGYSLLQGLGFSTVLGQAGPML